MGFRKRILKKLSKKSITNTTSTPGGASTKKRIPFSQSVYIPRWRLKNYYAVKEFGEEHRRWFIEQRYMYNLKKFPDLDNPTLFNEKIHWLNLYYHNPLITKCCDKYELKNYVAEKVGKEYVVPNIAVYDRASDIHFENLPDKFAIKVNWGDGKEFTEVVKDKNKVNEDIIKTKMNNGMRPWNNLYYSHFFWGYKNVKPKILVEKFLDSGGKDINDYKIHCFNGKAKVVLVCENRSNAKMNKTFLDIDWNVLPCSRPDGIVNPKVKKPKNYYDMLRIAKILSEPFPFVRVDFYSIKNKLYVGEMTFHPGCGWESFQPSEWNKKIGDMLELPKEKMIEEGLGR